MIEAKGRTREKERHDGVRKRGENLLRKERVRGCLFCSAADLVLGAIVSPLTSSKVFTCQR